MADEITIIRWCDVCPPRTQRAVKRWRGALGVDAGAAVAPRMLDTCEPCAGVVQVFYDLLKAHGRIDRGPAGPDAATTPTVELTCPVCATRIGARGSFIEHLANVHSVPKPTMPKRCPDAECRADFGGNPKSMLVHRVRKHGFDIVADMTVRAEKLPRLRIRDRG